MSGVIVKKKKGYLRDRHWFRYLGLVDRLLKNMARVYPGWRMRIYHNVTMGQADQAQFLCNLQCRYHDLDLCDVRQQPELVSHQSLESRVDLGRWWRFIVMGDPTVSLFGVRDLDMFMTRRERDAVGVWEEQEDHKQFYILRDTPQSRNKAGTLMPIKGGCWGGDNYKNFALARELRMDFDSTKKLIRRKVWKKEYPGEYAKFSEFFDMVWLRHLVWPSIRDHSLIFDSYTCKKHKEMGVGVPFPTRRRGHFYIGSGPTKGKVIARLMHRTCPVECRPPDHKNWRYC